MENHVVFLKILYSFDWIPQFITGDFDSIKEDILTYYKDKVQYSSQLRTLRNIGRGTNLGCHHITTLLLRGGSGCPLLAFRHW